MSPEEQLKRLRGKIAHLRQARGEAQLESEGLRHQLGVQGTKYRAIINELTEKLRRSEQRCAKLTSEQNFFLVEQK